MRGQGSEATLFEDLSFRRPTIDHIPIIVEETGELGVLTSFWFQEMWFHSLFFRFGPSGVERISFPRIPKPGLLSEAKFFENLVEGLT